MTTSGDTSARLTPSHWGWLAAFCLVTAAAYGPVLAGMGADWARDDNYSHGFLVPFVAAYALWIHRQRLADLVWRPSWFGLALIVLGVVALVLGEVGAEQFTKRVSFLIVIGGGILFLLGMPALRRLAFPYGYLFFMVPLPYIVYDSIAFPLKLMAARVASMPESRSTPRATSSTWSPPPCRSPMRVAVYARSYPSSPWRPRSPT